MMLYRVKYVVLKLLWKKDYCGVIPIGDGLIRVFITNYARLVITHVTV